MASSTYSPNLLQLPLQPPHFRLILAGISISRSKFDLSRKLLLLHHRNFDPIAAKEAGVKCFSDSTADRVGEVSKDGEDAVTPVEEDVIGQEYTNGSPASQKIGDALSLGIREPVYEVPSVALCCLSV